MFYNFFKAPENQAGIDSLPATVRDDIDSWLILPIGLALIVYMLVSVLTSIADKIVPIGLALIAYKLVSVLTLISCPLVCIDSLHACVRVNIDIWRIRAH